MVIRINLPSYTELPRVWKIFGPRKLLPKDNNRGATAGDGSFTSNEKIGCLPVYLCRVANVSANISIR